MVKGIAKGREFLLVLAVVALTALWIMPGAGGSPATESTPGAAHTPAVAVSPHNESNDSKVQVTSMLSTSRHPALDERKSAAVDGVELGSPAPHEASREMEVDEDGNVRLVRGEVLTLDGETLVLAGDSHDQVKERMGKPGAFSHGGVYWGYWDGTKPMPSKGVLIKFNRQGVEEITLSADWLPLSTELALSSGGEVVDGSDGYKDLREFLGGNNADSDEPR